MHEKLGELEGGSWKANYLVDYKEPIRGKNNVAGRDKMQTTAPFV